MKNKKECMILNGKKKGIKTSGNVSASIVVSGGGEVSVTKRRITRGAARRKMMSLIKDTIMMTWWRC